MKRFTKFWIVAVGLLLGIVQINAQTTTLKFGSNFTSAAASYTFTSGDVVYAVSGTLSTSTSNLCDGAPRRTQVTTLIYQLVSTSMGSFIINGQSSGSSLRSLSKIEVSDSQTSGYQEISNGSYTTSSTINSSSTCGTILASGLLIPSGKYVKLTFSGNVSLSSIVITASCTPIATSYTVSAGAATVCSSSTATTIGMSGSETGVSYQLYAGSTAEGSAVSGTGSALSWNVSPSATTTYTIKGTGVSGDFCTTETTIGSATVTVKDAPSTAVAGSNQTITEGQTATLAANVPTSGVGEWSIVSGPDTDLAQISDAAVNDAVFSPSTYGTYVLRWTISNSPCTASTSDVTITVNQLLEPIITYSSGSKTQSFEQGPTKAIEDIVYTIGGTADNFEIAWTPSQPTGIGANLSGNTVTISGIPSVYGSYSYSLKGIKGANKSIAETGSFTIAQGVAPVGTPAITDGATDVNPASVTVAIEYDEEVTIADADGITVGGSVVSATLDETKKILTINQTLSGSTNYNVSVAAGAITDLSGNAAALTAFSFTTSVVSSASDNFRSVAIGNWSNVTTWESSGDNTNWIAATLAPTNAAASITIQNGHKVSIDATTTASNTTVENGATLEVAENGTLAIASDKTLTVNGTLENAKLGSNPFSGTVIVNGIFNLTAVTTASNEAVHIVGATWNTGSVCKITGLAGKTGDYSGLNGINQTFDTFEFNVPNFLGKCLLQQNAAFGGAKTFLVNSTGVGTSNTGLQISTSTAGKTGITVDNYIQNGGLVYILSNSTNTTGRSTTVKYNFTLNGGTFNIGQYTGNPSSKVTTSLSIGGNLTVAAGATLTSEESYTNSVINLIFTDNTILSNEGTIANIEEIIVNAAKTLDMGTSVFGTNAKFTTNAGSIIKTANPTGIAGNLANITNKALNATTNYIYNGTVAQTEANLPATIGNLTIANTDGVTTIGETAAAEITINSGATLNLAGNINCTAFTNNGTLTCNAYSLKEDGTEKCTVTSVNSIASGKTIVSVKYYNLAGIEVSESAKGIVIAKITYEDGSVSTSKVVK